MCSVYMELCPIFEMGLKVIKFDRNAKTNAHGFFQKQKLVKTMESWDPLSPKRKGQYNTSTPLMNPLCQNVNDFSYVK